MWPSIGLLAILSCAHAVTVDAAAATWAGRSIGLLAILSCAHAATLDAAAAMWAGRTLAAPGNVSFSWEGVQASITVSGATYVTLLASSRAPGACAFHTMVNGALHSNWSFAASAPANVTVAAGLSPRDTLTVTVWYATDPVTVSWDSLPPWSHSFHAFATDGAFGAPPQKPARRLQIIGDSITAGNQIDPATCADDHLGTYGARLCQLFDADCQTLAISGKGLYVNCCDKDVTMTELFARTIVGFPELVWDDSAFTPDAVILALGTNDKAHNSGPAWVRNFTDSYAAFLQRLTRIHNNPDLPIFAAVGPITSEYYPWVAAAVAQAGVKNAQVLNFTAPVDRCNHPPWASHELMAQQAAPAIKAALGW